MSAYVCVVGAVNLDICGCPEKKLIFRDSNPGAVTLTPKEPQAGFESVKVVFDASGNPDSMSLRDTFGQTTEVKFLRFKALEQMNPDRFRFVIPKGVDVLQDA